MTFVWFGYILGHIPHNDCLLCIESRGLVSGSVVGHPLLCSYGQWHTECVLRQIMENITGLTKDKKDARLISTLHSSNNQWPCRPCRLNSLCLYCVQVCAPACCCPLSTLPLHPSRLPLLAVRETRIQSGPEKESQTPGWEGKRNGMGTPGTGGWLDGSARLGHS